LRSSAVPSFFSLCFFTIIPGLNKLSNVPASQKTPVQLLVPIPPLVDIMIIHIRDLKLTPPLSGWRYGVVVVQFLVFL
jgi:hypothetical protein